MSSLRKELLFQLSTVFRITSVFILSIPVVIALTVECDAHSNSREKSNQTIVDVSLKNVSTNALDWVKLKWPGSDIPGGILSPGISATTLSVKWPYSTNATITFVDDKTRERFNVSVSLVDINLLLHQGGVKKVIFAIQSYSNVNLVASNERNAE
jgi:hypothetical protein